MQTNLRPLGDYGTTRTSRLSLKEKRSKEFKEN